MGTGSYQPKLCGNRPFQSFSFLIFFSNYIIRKYSRAVLGTYRVVLVVLLVVLVVVVSSTRSSLGMGENLTQSFELSSCIKQPAKIETWERRNRRRKEEKKEERRREKRERGRA